MKLITPPGVRLASVMDEAQKPGFDALVYGAPGTGKTSLLFSLLGLPSVKGVLHLDFDVSPDSVPHSDRVAYVSIKPGAAGWEQCKEVLHWALNDDQAKSEINTIFVDGLTTANDNVMSWVLEKKGVKGRDGMLAIPKDFTDYRQVNTEVIGFVRYIRELAVAKNYHVVFTAHEKEFKDDRGKRNIYPVLSGQQKEIIPGIPSTVGRIVVGDGGKRYLTFATEDGHGLKYRQDAEQPRILPDRVEIKNFSDPKSKGETLATIAQKLGH